MKLIDAVSSHTHTLCGTRGQGYGRLRRLYGEKFYTTWDQIWNIPALEVQTPGTKNNVVSRNTTIPKKQKAKTSGFLIQFSPEKTERVEDIPISIHHPISSIPHLLGQGGFKPFLIPPIPAALTNTNDKARTDHSGQPPIYSPLAQPGQSSRTEQANQANLRIYAEENPKMSMPCSEVAGSNPAGAFRIPVITPFLEMTHEVHGKPCFTPS